MASTATSVTNTTIRRLQQQQEQREQRERKGKLTERMERAIKEKETGNAFFKKGHYERAIEHYGRAMELDPKDPIYPINRAMAHIKLCKWNEVDRDCTLGLTIQPDHVKGLWRRGIARRELGRLAEASEDLKKALELEPNNKVIMEELDKVQQAAKDKSEKETPAKQKQRRVPITEVDADEDERFDEPTKIAAPLNTAVPPLHPKTTPSPVERIVAKVGGSRARPALPRTSYEFERDWRAVEHDDERLYEYLKAIPSRDLPNIVASFFEPDYLARMIGVLQAKYLTRDTVCDVYETLVYLSRIERFRIVLGFLERDDRKAVAHLFQKVLEKFDSEATDVVIPNTTDETGARPQLTRHDIIRLSQVYEVKDLA